MKSKKKAGNINTPTLQHANTSIGVVGLGLMGCSIATCLLMAGHPVVAIAPIESDMQHAGNRIKEHLKKSKEEGLTKKTPGALLKKLSITTDYAALSDCALVIECTLENLEIKKTVFRKIEAVIKRDALLTSNTSAIPISILQKQTQFPERFF